MEMKPIRSSHITYQTKYLEIPPGGKDLPTIPENTESSASDVFRLPVLIIKMSATPMDEPKNNSVALRSTTNGALKLDNLNGSSCVGSEKERVLWY